jgi:hypothetical protein
MRLPALGARELRPGELGTLGLSLAPCLGAIIQIECAMSAHAFGLGQKRTHPTYHLPKRQSGAQKMFLVRTEMSALGQM